MSSIRVSLIEALHELGLEGGGTFLPIARAEWHLRESWH